MSGKTLDKDLYIEDLEKHVTRLKADLRRTVYDSTCSRRALNALVKRIEKDIPRIGSDKYKLCNTCGNSEIVIMAKYHKDQLQPLWAAFDHAYDLLYGSTLRLRNTFKGFYSCCENCDSGPTRAYVNQ